MYPNPECSHLPRVWLQGAQVFLLGGSQLLSHLGDYRGTRLMAGAPSDSGEIRKEAGGKMKAWPGQSGQFSLAGSPGSSADQVGRGEAGSSGDSHPSQISTMQTPSPSPAPDTTLSF